MNIGLTGSSGVLGTILRKKLKLKKKNFFLGKIQNTNHVKKWVKSNNFDYIIHLAAIVPTKLVKKNKKKAYQVNYEGTKKIIDAVNMYSKKKVWFFYSSSSHVYEEKNTIIFESNKKKPMTYYGYTKLKSENYILKNKDKVIPCIGRIFSFTSKNQNNEFLIPSIIKKLKSKNKRILFNNLNHDRDFLRVNDIILAILKLLSIKYKGVVNICSSKKTNLTDILFILNKKFKKEIYLTENKSKTSLIGSNKKLLKIGWKPNSYSYLKYLYKNF